MLYPGLVSVTFRAKSPAEIIALATSAELRGIEWGSDVHVLPNSLVRAAEIGRATADAGLEVPSYGSYYRLGDSEPYPFESYLETARILGAPVIRVWAGRLGSASADAAHRERLASDARQIARLAASTGITVALEFHGNTLTDSAASALAFVQQVDHPNLSLYWQSAIGMGFDDNLAELEAVLPHLCHVHCFHYAGEPPEQRLLAEGADPWRRYLARVATVPGDRYVMLEFVQGGEEDAFRRDAATLRQLLEGSQAR